MSSKPSANADTITWLQVHNLLPILGVLISGITIFNLLSNRVSLAEQKLGYLESQVNTCQQNVSGVRDQINENNLSIKELQSRQEVKGVSTIKKVTPIPTLKALEEGE